MSEFVTRYDARQAFADTVFEEAGFADASQGGAGAIILTGTPLRVCWANRAGAALFDADDYPTLAKRLGGADAGTRRRLEQLSRLAPGRPPRLERLRFTWALKARMVTLLCGPSAPSDEGPLLALLDVEPGAPGTLESWYAEPGGRAELPRLAQDDVARSAAASPPSTPMALMGRDDDVVAVRATLRDALGGTDGLRFLWRAGPDGRLRDIDQGLFDRIGLAWSPGGRLLADVAAEADPDAGAEIRRLLEQQATWTALDLPVPLGDDRFVLPVALSGSPVFGPSRRFEGYRGFGRIDVRRLASAPDGASGLREPVSVEAVPSPVAARGDGPAEPAEAASLGEGPPTAMELAGPVAEELAEIPPRSTNVVHLRPFHANRADGRSPGERSDEPSEIHGTDQRADGSVLSPSEHLAFQEIGRAISAVTEGATSSPTEETSAVEPSPLPWDPMRQASLLVEATAAGLLVVRHPKVVFANDAVLQALRFEDHHALADSLTVALARRGPLDEGSGRLRLPTALGSEVEFAHTGRRIVWEGAAALLLTLFPSDAASSPAQPEEPDRLALIEASREAMAIVVSGGVQFANRCAREWLGDAAMLSGMVAQESRDALANLMRGLEPGQRRDADLVGLRPDGARVPLAFDVTGLASGATAVVWRERSDASAGPARPDGAHDEESDDVRPEFLAKVSHQLRTPLNAILGFAEIMMDERFGPLGSPRYKDYLGDIHASGQYVMKLVGDLLDLSRIETGRHELAVAAVDVNRIIAECVSQSQGDAHRERVIVRTSLAQRLPLVLADDRSARQIITNILSNAIRFNEPGGQVIVSSAVTESGAVTVRIRDTGIGMSDAEVAAALEPFRQFVPAKGTGGSGLGLSLARALAAANGAALAIRSRPGEGTLVEVLFVAQPAAVARVPA